LSTCLYSKTEGLHTGAYKFAKNASTYPDGSV